MRTQLWQLACLYWTTANLLAFALMGLDKRRARRGCWRIVLVVVALLEGD